MKKLFLEILQSLQENTFLRVSLLIELQAVNKVAGWRTATP